MANEEKVNR